jgi:hypothetical protein
MPVAFFFADDKQALPRMCVGWSLSGAANTERIEREGQR